MPHRNRFVAASTALVLLIALIGVPLSASAAVPQVAGIGMARVYSGEQLIPGGESTPDIQVFTVLNAVDMIDSSHGWAVGYTQNDYPANAAKRGFVWSTADGGSTDATLEIAPNMVLNGVSAKDATHAWAVGTGQTIRMWNGATWAAQTAAAGTTDLNAVSFASTTTGFAAGANGRIITTTDGGATWTAAAGSPNDATVFTGVKAVSATDAWAVGKGGAIYHLAGGTWTKLSNVPAGTPDLYAVDFFDASHGVAVGLNSAVIETRDGGAHWTLRTAPAPTGIDPAVVTLHSVHMSGTSTIVAGGTYGTVLRSTDGGATWAVGQAYVDFAQTDYDWQINGIAAGPAAGDQTTLLFAGYGPGGPIASSTTPRGYVFSGAQPVVADTKPAKPTGLTALPGTLPPTVALTWTANAFNETGYRVKRTDNGAAQTIVADGLAPGTATWTDPDVKIGHAYVYTVVAYNAAGESDPESKSLTLTAATPVWRFYNFRTGTHFYTADPAEKDNVFATMKSTYSLDGVAYTVNSSNPANSAPLYRFYNLKTGTHFYTADTTERDRVLSTMAATYHLDGVAYKVSATNVDGATTVWRFYNLKTGTHFYTADAAEKANVLATMKNTYSLDGPGFYLAP